MTVCPTRCNMGHTAHRRALSAFNAIMGVLEESDDLSFAGHVKNLHAIAKRSAGVSDGEGSENPSSSDRRCDEHTRQQISSSVSEHVTTVRHRAGEGPQCSSTNSLPLPRPADMDFRSFPDLSLRAVSILKDSLDTPRAARGLDACTRGGSGAAGRRGGGAAGRRASRARRAERGLTRAPAGEIREIFAGHEEIGLRRKAPCASLPALLCQMYKCRYARAALHVAAP